jgi:hypothetical protein
VWYQAPDDDRDRRYDGERAERVEHSAAPRRNEPEGGSERHGAYDDRNRPNHRAGLPHSGRSWPA